MKEKLCSKINEQNPRKVVESLYIFLTTPYKVDKHVNMMQSSSPDNCLDRYNIKILNLFEPDLQLINTKPMIKNKLKNTVL